jgi:ankyrin repeat protein
LQFSAERGNIELVRLLVSRGVNLDIEGPGALGQAIFKGGFDVVQFLVERGVPINEARWNVTYKGKEDSGWSLLMVAIKREHRDIAAYLIRQGAKVNVRSRLGMTALKLAQLESAPDVARLLKKRGARE